MSLISDDQTIYESHQEVANVFNVFFENAPLDILSNISHFRSSPVETLRTNSESLLFCPYTTLELNDFCRIK